MTLSDKIALASRWYIRISSVIQLVSLALMVVALTWKTSTPIATDCCDTVEWWGTTSSCSKFSATTIQYLSARFITCMHGTWLAMSQTSEFDEAKKVQDARRARGSEGNQSGFDRLPASALSVCWTSLPSMFVACASLEVLLRHADSGKMSDWGQSAALITAVVGILHWMFVFQRSWEQLPGPFSNRFDLAKHQFLDFTRLHHGNFPDFLEMEAVPLLQQDLMMSIRNRLNSRADDILSVIGRRTSRGDYISVDFIDDKATPLLMAIERGSDDLVSHLLKLHANVAVAPTRPAIVAAAWAGQWDILVRLLDDGRCSVPTVLEALIVLNDRSDNRSGPADALQNMLRYIRKQAISDIREVQSKLINLAVKAKSPMVFDAIVTCGLINEQTRDDGQNSLFQRLVHVPFRLRHLRKNCPSWSITNDKLLAQMRYCMAIGDLRSVSRVLGLGAVPMIGQTGDFLVEPEFETGILQGMPSAVIHPTESSSPVGTGPPYFARDLLAQTPTHPDELIPLLPWGALTGRTDIVRSLLAMGAWKDTYIVIPYDVKIHVAGPHTEVGACLNALQVAAWMGVPEVLKLLLEAGLNSNWPSASLKMASSTTRPSRLKRDRGKRSKTGDVRGILDLLIGPNNCLPGIHSRSENLIKDRRREKHSSPIIKRTALQFAVENHYTDIVKLLLDAGALADLGSVRYALEASQIDIARLLMEAPCWEHAEDACLAWLLCFGKL